MPSGMGRLYVFREIGSFGADIDDDVTINAVPVQRLRPGMGFYCDVRPGSYVVSVLRHKTNSLNVSMASGQSQYLCVMLHRLGGVSPRGGSLIPINHSMFISLSPVMAHNGYRNIV